MEWTGRAVSGTDNREDAVQSVACRRLGGARRAAPGDGRLNLTESLREPNRSFKRSDTR